MTNTASSTKTFGGTPMVQSLSQQGFGTASPSGMIGINGTLSGLTGLGVDLLGTPGAMTNTPSGLNMGMGMGMNMASTMSELGLSLTVSGGHKRNEDEDRRGKMRKILKKIGRPRGRISEEGICRVGRRVGFANDIDGEDLKEMERLGKVGNRAVTIAGETVFVEVDMKNHVPREVTTGLQLKGDNLSEMAAKAGEVLFESLKDTDNLAAFAKGVDWIAKIDGLGAGKVNGFEALGGIYGSLRRLFNEEVRIVEENGTTGRGNAEMLVMCKRSGKPVQHERGALGISLDYWQESRAALSRNANGTEMDIDSNGPHAAATTSPSLHSLHIDLERCPPEMYTPIRIAFEWLPEKLTLDPAVPIPWQDPDATFLSSDGPDESMADNDLPNDQQKLLPSLRFLAKLDPPVVLPWQTATALLTTFGAVMPQAFPTPPLLQQLLIPASVLGSVGNETHKTVFVQRGPEPEAEAEHVYRLHVAKAEYGFRIDDLPFAHPRQLVENLPLLRQWGCFGALVQDVFASAATSSPPGVQGDSNRSRFAFQTNVKPHEAAKGTESLSVDVALAYTPSPKLSLAFPTLDGAKSIAVKLAVGLNGEISVNGTITDGAGDNAHDIDGKKALKWAKGLEICGTVGVWIEWIRGEESA
jgi:hypothetical protein